jgi:hypothetical protein
MVINYRMDAKLRNVVVGMLLLLCACCAGCTTPPSGPDTTTGQGGALSTAQGTPAPGIITTQPMYQSIPQAAQTNAPQNIPSLPSAYIRRPYGYQQYSVSGTYLITPVESHVETDQSGNQVIVGRVKNEGSTTVDLVVVTLNLYDANGFLIGNRYASADFLKPGRTFKYTTSPITETGFVNFEVADIFSG